LRKGTGSQTVVSGFSSRFKGSFSWDRSAQQDEADTVKRVMGELEKLREEHSRTLRQMNRSAEVLRILDR
jgi:hypothetical protein